MRTTFESEALSEFLNDGWLLSLDGDRLLVGWGARRSPANESSGASFYAPGFYDLAKTENQLAWQSPQAWDVVERDRFSSVVISAVQKNVKSNVASKREPFQWVEPALEEFEPRWRELREGMDDRGLTKGVPVVFARAQGTFDHIRRLQSLRSLVNLPRQSYLYGAWSVHEGMLGATPEILFSKTGSDEMIETVALAGTRPRDAEAAQLLMKDPKERYEHQLVINDVQAQLSLIGDVAVGTTQILELPTLLHLKTRIQSRPHHSPNFVELAQLLHPTPALGVAPRALGFTEMRRWETSIDRLRFGAPFGAEWKEDGHTRFHCVVAIRNVQWRGDQLMLGSGCGVVGESRLEREWDELRLKRESVKRMLDI